MHTAHFTANGTPATEHPRAACCPAPCAHAPRSAVPYPEVHYPEVHRPTCAQRPLLGLAGGPDPHAGHAAGGGRTPSGAPSGLARGVQRLLPLGLPPGRKPRSLAAPFSLSLSLSKVGFDNEPQLSFRTATALCWDSPVSSSAEVGFLFLCTGKPGGLHTGPRAIGLMTFSPQSGNFR